LRLSEIRVPPGALDPTSHHVIAARDEIGIVLRLGRQDRQDLIADLRGAAFVRIEAEDPIVAAFRKRAIAQITKTLEGNLHDPRAQALGDLSAAIGAPGISHYDLVRPQHARHRVGDLLGFIVGEDVCRYFLHDQSTH
jgi:hypothetical protein